MIYPGWESVLKAGAKRSGNSVPTGSGFGLDRTAMSSNALGMVAASALVMILFGMTLPRVTTHLDSSPNTYLAPSSRPAEVRDEIRDKLTMRNAYRREPLGWKYSAPPRMGIFRPCRNTEGPAADGDSDGLVDNVTPEGRWRKDWAVLNPAVADPGWTTLTAAEREAAIALARLQAGVGSDFGRGNEPDGADCDQQRGGISQGPYYGRH